MLAKLITEGVIGPLRIGLPISELIAHVGLPPSWEGKPGSILGHWGIVNYKDSSVWIYNGVHADITGGEIKRLTLWLDNNQINLNHEWFRKWPISSLPKLSEIRDYLDTQQIPYATSDFEMGYDIIMYKAYVIGAVKLKDEPGDRVSCIVRVKDYTDVPMGVSLSIVNKLKLI